MNKTLLLAAALALPAVADAEPMGEKVTAEVVGIEDVRIGLGAAGFTVVTELTRKKAPPMILTGLRFDVLIDGQKIGEGTLEDTHRLKRNTAVRVEIPTQVMATAGLMAIMSSSNAELSIAGEVSGRWLFFKQERTFAQTISLQDVMDTVQ
ncbi:MAG: hypothetical protein P8R54_01845 [Myxococcota bacterium]|nr:hypothetical protein [Myxococcota bacterium]